VLKLATTLIGDHTAASVRLAAYATRRGIAIDPPPQPRELRDLDERAARLVELKELERLETLKAEEFDEAFLALADTRHRLALQQAERAHARVRDPELKELLATLLPVLREHVRMTWPPPVAPEPSS
jgi:predicted outer membrane protein